MPSHMWNRLEIYGTDIQVHQIREFLKGEPFKDGSEMYIDFNKINKMPDELNIASTEEPIMIQLILFGRENLLCRYTVEEAQIRIEECTSSELSQYFNEALLLHTNQEKFGHSTWYTWNIANWRTKWNAYSQKLDAENVLRFLTAWNGVLDLMIDLSELFPDVTLLYHFDNCYDSYNFEIKNGEILYDEYEVLGEIMVDNSNELKNEEQIAKKRVKNL